MTRPWRHLLARPASCQDVAGFESWFSHVADRLLNGAALMANGERLRLVEIEFYYRSPDHADPFTHGQDIQRECGRWYFHRHHGGYRGGSYTGLDLTFGDGEALGGILIRSIERVDGSLINGPSLCVDHLLRLTRTTSVAGLDHRIAGRFIWNRASPIHVCWLKNFAERPIYRSSRVGLSLKKLDERPEAMSFLMRPYRFLTEPRRVRKGRIQLVLSLHVEGLELDAIRSITGCPRVAIKRYVRAHEAGLAGRPTTVKTFNMARFCGLHGRWHAKRR